MAKPQIEVWEDFERDTYYVAWWSPEDGPGLSLGDGRKSVEELARLQEEAKQVRTEVGREEFETLSAELATAKWFLENPHAAQQGPFHLEFESSSEAKKLLKTVRAAVECAIKEYNGTTPMPEWAVKAFAAGFKAPKGWKP